MNFVNNHLKKLHNFPLTWVNSPFGKFNTSPVLISSSKDVRKLFHVWKILKYIRGVTREKDRIPVSMKDVQKHSAIVRIVQNIKEPILTPLVYIIIIIINTLNNSNNNITNFLFWLTETLRLSGDWMYKTLHRSKFTP